MKDAPTVEGELAHLERGYRRALSSKRPRQAEERDGADGRARSGVGGMADPSAEIL